MKKFLTLTIIAIIALIGLTVSVNAASTDVSTLADLKSALEGTEYDTITLENSITISAEETLDLNGKTLTQGSNSIIVENGVLTVKNGTILADKDAFQILSAGSAILNIEKDVNVTAGYNAVYIRYPGAVLNTAGNLTSTGTYATIQGNGSDSSGGVIVNITGGTITSSAEGVYFPNTAELNISGGTITGTTAVYHKSGKLNISGGTLKATGTKADYVHNPNGCNATGDALVVEASDYPGGVPVVSITGGTFISENNKAVAYYQQTEDYELANENFITGGVFSSDVSSYVDSTLEAVEDEDGNVYVGTLHTITVADTENGEVTADKTEAVKGQTIKLTITPDEGYEVDTISLDYGGYGTGIADDEFTMIDSDVKVFVTFKAIAEEELPGTETTPEDKDDEKDKTSGTETTPEDKEDEKDETPATGLVDVVVFASVIVAVISLAGIVTIKKYTR